MRKYWIAQKKWALKSDYHLYRLKNWKIKEEECTVKVCKLTFFNCLIRDLFSFAPKLEHVQVSKKSGNVKTVKVKGQSLSKSPTLLTAQLQQPLFLGLYLLKAT